MGNSLLKIQERLSPSEMPCNEFNYSPAQPVPNAINILQACIYKSVSTGLFLISFLAPSIVKLNVGMINS